MDPNAVDMSAEMQSQIDAKRQEATARTESAPVESNAPEAQTAPVGELDQPEKKVSEAVPYERFKAVNDRVRELEAQINYGPSPASRQPTSPLPGPAFANDVLPLDPEVVPAVQQLIRQEMENDRASKFIARHSRDLADPLLRGAVSAIIHDANERGMTVDQEDALSQAKSLLDERAKPKVEQAQTQAFSEGQELAQAKQRAGAVGETTKAAPPVDPDKMSAADFAKFMNIPRHTG